MRRNTRWQLAATMLCGSALTLFAACGSVGEAEPDDERLHLVATTAVLGDVTAAVARDGATVTVLIDAEQDPHSFSASAADISMLADADLVVANGLSLETAMVDTLAAVEAEGTPVIRVAELVDPIPFAGPGAITEGLDPHFWHDPIRMMTGVDLIASALSELNPEASSAWHAQADEFNAEIAEAHVRVQQILGAIDEDDRKLVTNHDSMSYLARRYGFEVIASVIPGGTTIGSPSTADLSDLVDTLRVTGVNAIFAETTQPDDLARAVAAELGHDVDVVVLHSASLGPAGEPADSYLGMLVVNAELIAGALAG